MNKYAEKKELTNFGQSDYQKAQIFNWFRNRCPQHYEPHMRKFLAEYEYKNGRLAYDDFAPNVKESFHNRLRIYGAKNNEEQAILDSLDNKGRGTYIASNQFYN